MVCKCVLDDKWLPVLFFLLIINLCYRCMHFNKITEIYEIHYVTRVAFLALLTVVSMWRCGNHMKSINVGLFTFMLVLTHT